MIIVNKYFVSNWPQPVHTVTEEMQSTSRRLLQQTLRVPGMAREMDVNLQSVEFDGVNDKVTLNWSISQEAIR